MADYPGVVGGRNSVSVCDGLKVAGNPCSGSRDRAAVPAQDASPGTSVEEGTRRIGGAAGRSPKPVKIPEGWSKTCMNEASRIRSR